MLVGDIVSSNARLYPNKPCVVDGKVRLTCAQFNDRVNRLANALLGLGLKKGTEWDCFRRTAMNTLNFFLLWLRLD